MTAVRLRAPSVRNTVARVGWAALALLAVAMSVFVALEPMYQINDCWMLSLGQPECQQSIFSNFGPVMIPVLAVPVLLCLAPVLWTRRPVAIAVVGGLFVLSIGATGWMDTPIAALMYFLPVALIAVILAAVQGPRRRDSAG